MARKAARPPHARGPRLNLQSPYVKTPAEAVALKLQTIAAYLLHLHPLQNLLLPLASVLATLF